MSQDMFLTEVNKTLYFVGSDPEHGVELWKVDGVTGKAELVKDIWTCAGSSYPKNLTNVDGILFFTATDDNNGRELWRSDGTPAGSTSEASGPLIFPWSPIFPFSLWTQSQDDVFSGLPMFLSGTTQRWKRRSADEFGNSSRNTESRGMDMADTLPSFVSQFCSLR